MSEKQEPKSIVCFGDSLTWGFNPKDRSRYGHDVRWTRLLQKELGEGYYVVEEGLNGRTTVFEDPVKGDKNGLAHLATVLESHKPVDLLILMLGTNNLQHRFNMSAAEVTSSMQRLVELAVRPMTGPEGTPPKILLMAPPPANDFMGTVYEDHFLGERTCEISRKLAPLYAQLADDFGISFLDTGKFVSASAVDAIHLDPETQPVLAKAIAEKLREIF